ncbi:MAG: hypothetical protein J6V54_10135 [Bacteroidales bacterium]|nr:hypothetical protein [Bacteroidales bacterium]
MNNEQEIEKLLEKFYDGTIEQAELDRLCSWFLHTDEVPPKWRADAILLRSIGIERYCNRHKQEFAAFVDSHLPSKAGKRKTVLRNVFAHYGYGAAAAAICFVLTFTATSLIEIRMKNYKLDNEAVVAKAEVIPLAYVAKLDSQGVFCNDGCDALEAVSAVYKRLYEIKIA